MSSALATDRAKTRELDGAAVATGRQHRLLIALLTIVILAVYVLRLDRVIGLFVDDAWYVLLAKALATGQGYTLINAPTPGIVPFYPPAFPWLLSLAYRLAPQFPENVLLFKAILITVMLAVGVASAHYLHAIRGISLAIAVGIGAATVLSPGFVFLATSTVMSEPVFTLELLLTLVAVERTVRATGSSAVRYALLAGVFASLGVLTRSIAVSVVGAVLVYLLKERRRREAAIFTFAVAVLAGPWMAYARIHAPTKPQQRQENHYITESYGIQLWERIAGRPALGTISVSELPGRIMFNVRTVVTHDIGALEVDPLYRATEPAAWRKAGVGVRILSALLCTLTVLGYASAVRRRLTMAELILPASLAVTLPWPFPPFRFLLPLLPLLLFYTITGLEVVAMWFAPARARSVAMVAVSCMVAINLFSNAEYIYDLWGPATRRPAWNVAFEENEVLLRWVADNLPPSAVLSAQNPALTYLFTDRKTVGTSQPAYSIVNRVTGVAHYWIETSYQPPDSLSWVGKARRVVYRSPRLGLRVVEF
jgi:hypothetical protein